MPVQLRAQKNNKKHQATLYALVFDTYTIKLAALLLFGFLLIQPISFAFAFEEEGATPPDEVVIESDLVSIVEDVVVDEPKQPEVIPEAEVASLSVETASEEVALEQSSGTQEVTDETTVLEEQILEEESGSLEVTLGEEVSTTDDVPETGETDTVDDGSLSATSTATSTKDVIEETATTTPKVVEEEVATTTEGVIEEIIVATSTPTTTETVVSGHNASAFSFDTTQCAVVGDGAYYCSEKEASTTMYTDGVFSAPDNDGDLEIYMRVGGVTAQITHNVVDDSAPYFDALSKRVVWHSSQNDRYQIVSYDTVSGEMTRLTSTSYNNMEPVASGDITLWQAWIDNNWEIMLFDGTTQRQLTNNTLHDVSPHMREGYILWQTQFEDGWQVSVYNQETKTIEYIPSEGGLKVENPRFVLVYDSTDANGDVKTVGYDFDSKSSFNLGVLPQDLPSELPEPDQTGETRALIQNKQTSREGEQEVVDVTSDPVSTSTGTTTDLHTLDLSQGIVASSSATTSGPIADIVVPTFTSAATTSQDTFSLTDVVIPPFTATTTQ